MQRSRKRLRLGNVRMKRMSAEDGRKKKDVILRKKNESLPKRKSLTMRKLYFKLPNPNRRKIVLPSKSKKRSARSERHGRRRNVLSESVSNAKPWREKRLRSHANKRKPRRSFWLLRMNMLATSSCKRLKN